MMDEEEMSKVFTCKLPDGIHEAFEAKVKSSGRTAYAILQELAIQWVQEQSMRKAPPVPQRTAARPLWELLPRIDRFVREGIAHSDAAYQALMRELKDSKGSPELEELKRDWLELWSATGDHLWPLDRFIRGCCERDKKQWEDSLPKLRQKKTPPPIPEKA
jgi:hypothetical protein